MVEALETIASKSKVNGTHRVTVYADQTYSIADAYSIDLKPAVRFPLYNQTGKKFEYNSVRLINENTHKIKINSNIGEHLCIFARS